MTDLCGAGSAHLANISVNPEGSSVGDEYLIQYTLHSLNLQIFKQVNMWQCRNEDHSVVWFNDIATFKLLYSRIPYGEVSH